MRNWLSFDFFRCRFSFFVAAVFLVGGFLAGFAYADEPPRFLRGINLNGPPVVIDENRWEGKESEHYVCSDKAFEQQAVQLLPSTDVERAQMIRSSRWGGNRVELTNLPAGPLTLFLYVWEDNDPETYSVLVGDRELISRYNSGQQGQWQRLGPWIVEASDADQGHGKLVLTSRGGTANFSGIEIWQGEYDGNASPKWTSEQLALFENRIRPLLIKHCYECHSTDSDDLQAGLLVDSRPTLLRGGESGPALVPGDIAHSLILKAVKFEDGLEMPPDEQLSEMEIADLEKWVAMGAPDPRSEATRYVRKKIDVEKARQFWSLRPVQDPQLPEVTQPDWPRNEVDNFILAKIEEQGLSPAKDADKLTLIRRASYDLTGLPPSPAEVDEFLADSSEQAFAKVVDRLLESKQYGERWGRHWMDLVRYADTAGDNSDFPVPEAYLYRNYIIDSFNNDKPYDQFIREQIAGDLLPADNDELRNEQTIATGYIAISRRFGSLADNYPQHLTIEDTLDNIGRTLLGTTITCARCHDHKFDPISQEDYYGLYGIFQSTRYPFPGIELEQKPRDFVPLFQQGKPATDLCYAVAEGSPADAAMHLRGEPSKPGEVIPRKFPEVLGGAMLDAEALGQSGRLQLAQWLTAEDNPLTARVMVNRIWQYHFGSALVKTPSDFGTRGTPPTHPQLLDWLASRFIESGWSIKQMHRRLMLSRVYQLSSQVDKLGQASAEDPNNDLLWRFNRRRLDAEELRDTLLLASGELDMNMVRRPHPFPPAKDWKYTQHHPFRDAYESNHRSVYLMTARLNARPFFTTFDGADRNASTAQRDSSVTTIQSLYLLNDDFVHLRSVRFADRLLDSFDTEARRLDMAFRYALARSPRKDEVESAENWLATMQKQLQQSGMAGRELDEQKWAAFARVLFRINEFLYID